MIKLDKEYINALQFFEDKITSDKKQLENVEKMYADDIRSKFEDLLKNNKFFKTNDGYIYVKEIRHVYVSHESKFDPIIVLRGFHLRGYGLVDRERNGVLYGYYDEMAGFVLSELKVTTKEIFIEMAEKVCNHIIENLNYKPTHLYREEGDYFDTFISSAKQMGVDVEYYPDVKITID